MEEDHEDDYEPSDFLKQNRDLLRGFSFKFEGLTPHQEKQFKNAVQDLGALVSDNAKYTMAVKSYLKLDINENRTDLYNLCYILDSLTAKRPLDIELYRHNKEKISNESTKSSKIDDIVNSSSVNNDIITEKSKDIYISKKPCTSTNNLENAKDTKLVSKKVPAKIKENDELMDVDIDKKELDIDEKETDSLIINNKKNYKQSNKTIMRQEVQNKINSNTSNKVDDEILNLNKLPNPLAKINRESAFQTMNSKTVECGDEGINEKKIKLLERPYCRKENQINQINKITNVKDTCENLSDNTKTISHEKSSISKNCVNQLPATENHKSIDQIKIEQLSDNESSLDNTQVSENNRQIDRKDTRSHKEGYKRIKKKVIDSSSSTDDDLTDNSTRPSTSKNIQNLNDKKHPKKVSGWIDVKSSSNDSLEKVCNKIKKKKVDHHSSDSDVVYDSDEEIRKLNNHKYWWLKQHIPDSDACSHANCTFEPVRHRSHAYPGRMLSDDEKKIILKYLIMNKCIQNAKGAKVWNNMLEDGYLTHRTAETLRNCLRRSILSNITSFGLPTEILDEFFELEDRKVKRS